MFNYIRNLFAKKIYIGRVTGVSKWRRKTTYEDSDRITVNEGITFVSWFLYLKGNKRYFIKRTQGRPPVESEHMNVASTQVYDWLHSGTLPSMLNNNFIGEAEGE